MLHVIAILTAVPGRRADLLEAFLANVPSVRAEDGCLEYTATVDAEGIGPPQAPLGPDTFVVVEKWASSAALHAHGSAPHMTAYSAKTKELLATASIHVLSPA